MKQLWRPFLFCLLLATAASVLLSCGGNGNSTNCATPTALTISPTTGSADHTAVPPGNQVQYSGALQYPAGCVLPTILPVLTWSTSDTTDTSIGTPPNAGLATCLNATPQAATITGSLPGGSLKGTATLSCK